MERTELALTSKSHAPDWTAQQIDLIKKQVAPEATNDELNLFLYHCKKTGLDPLSKQIYFQKRKGRPVFITSIDGFRLIAARTGEHAGTDDAIFDDEEKPNKATITVYRLVHGTKASFTASARWSEYCPAPGQDHMWQKMPCTMLSKCAESLALRKAFANELGGTYISEEMDQAKEPSVINKNSAPTITIIPEMPSISATPVHTAPIPHDPGNYIIPFGKFTKGKPLKDIHPDELNAIACWLEATLDKATGKSLMEGKYAELYAAIGGYLGEGSMGEAPMPEQEDIKF